MKIKYKLLDNKKGIILERKPVFIKEDEITVHFGDRAEGLTAVFEGQYGSSIYRKITQGECTVPSRKMNGAVNVAVLFDNIAKWRCEKLLFEHTGGGIIVSPNYADLENMIVELYKENSELRLSIQRLEKNIADIRQDINKMKEGWDIT